MALDRASAVRFSRHWSHDCDVEGASSGQSSSATSSPSCLHVIDRVITLSPGSPASHSGHDPVTHRGPERVDPAPVNTFNTSTRTEGGPDDFVNKNRKCLCAADAAPVVSSPLLATAPMKKSACSGLVVSRTQCESAELPSPNSKCAGFSLVARRGFKYFSPCERRIT